MTKREELIDSHKAFMTQVKSAIESFGVTCSSISGPIKGDKSVELYFNIDRNKRNIMRFKERIGFRLNQDKRIRLENCYNIIADSLNNNKTGTMN
jgi:hypothetical protein